MSDYLKLPETYLPKSYRGRVNWYISFYLQDKPIHLFATKQQAYEWAKTQTPEVVGDVVMTPSFDWFPAGSNPARTISNRRPFVDHREHATA
jgi:hypothetical protein